MRTYKILASIALVANCLWAQDKSPSQRARPASETSVPGDAAHGQAIFEGKGNCLSCHRVLDKGSRLGSNLTDIATRRTVEELQKALTDPPQQVEPQNRLFRVVTRDGTTVTGKLLNQNQSSLQMLDTNDRLVAFQRSNVRQAGFVETPPMPSYRDKLAADELKDLIAYLASLKGVNRE